MLAGRRRALFYARLKIKKSRLNFVATKKLSKLFNNIEGKMNDKQIDKLLVDTARGDNDAFAQLYERTKHGVFSFLYSYLNNYEDTEDAMQTVYIKIKTNIDKYTPDTNGRAWILQIAKNIALNELYNKKRANVNIDDINIKDRDRLPMGVAETMQAVLDEEERRIIILHVLWGYKHREIARRLNCPTGTVTSKYKRSVQKLKEALKEAEQ